MLSNLGQKVSHQCLTDVEPGRRAIAGDAHRANTKSRSDQCADAIAQKRNPALVMKHESLGAASEMG